MCIRTHLLIVFAGILWSSSQSVQAQESVPASPRCTMPDTSVRKLPFAREDDLDGARFVWFSSCRAGHPYAYVRTADVPRSRYFREIDPTAAGESVRAGDVAWWPTFMALTEDINGPLASGPHRVQFEDMIKRYGPPRFFRRMIPVDRDTPREGRTLQRGLK
jgi:hypothetical protein